MTGSWFQARLPQEDRRTHPLRAHRVRRPQVLRRLAPACPRTAHLRLGPKACPDRRRLARLARRPRDRRRATLDHHQGLLDPDTHPARLQGRPQARRSARHNPAHLQARLPARRQGLRAAHRRGHHLCSLLACMACLTGPMDHTDHTALMARTGLTAPMDLTGLMGLTVLTDRTGHMGRTGRTDIRDRQGPLDPLDLPGLPDPLDLPLERPRLDRRVRDRLASRVPRLPLRRLASQVSLVSLRKALGTARKDPLQGLLACRAPTGCPQEDPRKVHPARLALPACSRGLVPLPHLAVLRVRITR